MNTGELPAGVGDAAARRAHMVEHDIAGRGVRDPDVLRAMGSVPRERFLPADLDEFAYEDHPLPIAEGQTISQPFIVATMAEAAEIEPDDRVLEVGTGSGYGAAVLAQIAGRVWTIERHRALAEGAARVLRDLRIANVEVVYGDGSLGLPEAAPFDAVVVTAGGPSVPEALLDQLADGGRLIIPVGPESRGQELVRVRRDGDRFDEEDLGPVRFVPLVGEQAFRPVASSGSEGVTLPIGSPPARSQATIVPARAPAGVHGTSRLIAEEAERMGSVADADLGPLLERIGDRSLVLIGEASHGTSEFYRMRERITRELVLRKGFDTVAIEADWPDAASVDAWVRDRPVLQPVTPFERFPTWMWRNREFGAFVRWLRDHNVGIEDPSRRVAVVGLDLYSMFTSRDVVLSYLDRVDPAAATVARARYGCLTPWEHDPALYGRAVVTGEFAGCEAGVAATLTDLLRARLAYAARDGDAFLDATQNAAVVADAERYYRIMYYGAVESWNLRDLHMFETLRTVQAHRGPGTKVVVWEHNSHVGDAGATEMGTRGEHNVGQLCRREFGDDAYLIGFGTDHGAVAAAAEWGGPMQHRAVRPSHARSYERLFHDSEVAAFLLHLRDPRRRAVRDELEPPRLERAIGVIYRPETELQSHYFQASLPGQFDEYIWIDETTPVHASSLAAGSEAPDTFPFGL